MAEVFISFVTREYVNKNRDRIISFLPREDVIKAENYKTQKNYCLSLGASYLLRKNIGKNCIITKNSRGKPYTDKMFFSISHSQDLAGVAVCRDFEVGLDIEKAREKDFKPLIDYCFSPE